MDLDTAADIKFYAIPDLQKRLKELEVKKAEKEASGEVSSAFDDASFEKHGSMLTFFVRS